MNPLKRCPRCHHVTRATACPTCGGDLVDDRLIVESWHPTVWRALFLDLVRVRWGEHLVLLRFLIRWVLIGSVIGALAGASSAIFLYGLRVVTLLQGQDPRLLYWLPIGGLSVGLAYHYVGDRSAAGNNLILDEVHGFAGPLADTSSGSRPPGGRDLAHETWVPVRLAPLVLIGTWVTHLFGGSAGREGTAIQMSGALSDGFARLVGFDRRDRRLVLIAAISGGFASVFGVPLAGTVFGLEVLAVGRIRYDAIVPALTAAMVGNIVFDLIHLPHDVTPSHALPEMALSAGLLAKVGLAGLAFGFASVLFSELTDGIKRMFAVLVVWPPLRPFVGGLMVIGLVLLTGTRDYLGLSLPLIDDALTGSPIVWYAFALKLLFTAVTLGAGFQGGEVTPLFVIGATLGAALAGPLGVPVDVLASVGFVAVFAAATNTPLACTIMGIELFGIGALPYLAVGCVVAYVFSAHRGIYASQRIDTPKDPHSERPSGETLRDLSSRRSRPRRAGGSHRKDDA
jgi:H+/Cl- antiporter ClcA